MSNPVRILFVTALLAGLYETALTPFMDVPAAAAAFAVLFYACAFWVHRRPRVAAVVVTGLLFGSELAFLPLYERETTGDWIVQLTFGALSAVGFAASVAGVFALRRERPALASR